MMDTVLNLGMNDAACEGLSKLTAIRASRSTLIAG